jgi:hypothetical protein
VPHVADVDFEHPASGLVPASLLSPASPDPASLLAPASAPPLPDPDPELDAAPELEPDDPSAREPGAPSFGWPESDPVSDELEPPLEPELEAAPSSDASASGKLDPCVLEHAATRTRDNDAVHVALRIILLPFLVQAAKIASQLDAPPRFASSLGSLPQAAALANSDAMKMQRGDGKSGRF